DVHHLGAVREVPSGGVRRTDQRVRRPSRVVTDFWCELAWLGAERGAPEAAVQRGVRIAVEGDRIIAVEVGTDPSPDAQRLSGLTLPGFANAHSHAFHRALRGRTHGEAGSFWTWRQQMYTLAARLAPDSYLQLATATFA